ncbi:hypothetical protein [Escherichia coli]|nr:hypothetical protein [Escherichia coli]
MKNITWLKNIIEAFPIIKLKKFLKKFFKKKLNKQKKKKKKEKRKRVK